MTDTSGPGKSGGRWPRRNRRGFALMEMVLTLIVIIFALAGVFGIYSLITQSQREMQTRQLVQHIIGGVRGLYTSSVNYTGLTAAMLVNASKVPENYVRGTAIETPFGGAVTLGGWDGGWSVGIVNTRTDTCIAVLSEFVDGTGFHDQLTGAANVAAVPSPLVDASASATTIIASVAAINTACAGANKNLVLEFR